MMKDFLDFHYLLRQDSLDSKISTIIDNPVGFIKYGFVSTTFIAYKQDNKVMNTNGETHNSNEKASDSLEVPQTIDEETQCMSLL